MNSPAQSNNAHLASAWATGIGLLFLAIGLQGALRPLDPAGNAPPSASDGRDAIVVEFFESPPAPAAAEIAAEDAPEDETVEDLVIPPPPAIAPPLTPPEMVELVAVEEIVRKSAPRAPEPHPMAAKPEPRPSAPPSGSTGTATGSPGGTSGGTGAPMLFTGTGSGRFPAPSYPSSARRARLEGTVKLLVTVEPSGVPSTVSITGSSGHSTLDAAARDHVRRRWRWPKDEARRFIVPIKFVIQ